jgi:FkbM family methyltransferase
MSRTSERYRLFRRVESRLRHGHVPRAASDRLAGPIVGGGFRLRGIDAEFEINSVKLVAPRRFVSNYFDTEYEPELVTWLQHTLAPGCVVIDAGAHIGYLSIVMARLVGGSGHVFAIEPALENVEYLSRNVRANCVQNVDILPVALAEQPGLASFNINGSSDSFGFFEHPNTATVSSRSVPVMSIDSIFSESSLARLDLVKIDVEGGELEVLAGLRATLDRFPRVPLIVEWFPAIYANRGLGLDSLPRELERLGYALSVLDAAGGGPSTVAAAREALGRKEVAPFWYCNLLAQR